MKHRGEIIKKAIEQSGIKKIDVAKSMKMSQSSLYRLFEDPFVTYDDILQIGKIIKHNFSKEFPELANPLTKSQEDNLDYKLKYMELAEKYIKVLEEKEQLLKKASSK